jgi:hypothetical protein
MRASRSSLIRFANTVPERVLPVIKNGAKNATLGRIRSVHMCRDMGGFRFLSVKCERPSVMVRPPARHETDELSHLETVEHYLNVVANAADKKDTSTLFEATVAIDLSTGRPVAFMGVEYCVEDVILGEQMGHHDITYKTPTMRIHSIEVKPDFWRKGISEKLWKTAFEMSLENGIRSVVVEPLDENAQDIHRAFFKKHDCFPDEEETCVVKFKRGEEWMSFFLLHPEDIVKMGVGLNVEPFLIKNYESAISSDEKGSDHGNL